MSIISVGPRMGPRVKVFTRKKVTKLPLNKLTTFLKHARLVKGLISSADLRDVHLLGSGGEDELRLRAEVRRVRRKRLPVHRGDVLDQVPGP